MPSLLIVPGASVHHMTLRPQQAQKLRNSDIIFINGLSLTPWLEKTLVNLEKNADIIILGELAESHRYPQRQSTVFSNSSSDRINENEHGYEDRHEYKDRHEYENEHGYEDRHEYENEHGYEDRHEYKDRHEYENEHGYEDRHEYENEYTDGHKAEHQHGYFDPHAWLDSENAILWLKHIAKVLSKHDPHNKARYHANAQTAIAQIAQLNAKIIIELAAIKKRKIIVYHDALQYFERRFGLQIVAAIRDDSDMKPNAKRLIALRTAMKKIDIACVLVPTHFNSSLLKTVVNTTAIKTITIDIMGTSRNLGMDLYKNILYSLSRAIAMC